MRALEAQSEAAGVSTEQLMANAGLAVAQEAWLLLGTLEDRRITVLVGPGNNGGDGLVAASHLAEWGAGVVCYLLREGPDDANLQKAIEQGAESQVLSQDTTADAIEASLAGTDLVIDALLGTGARSIEDGSLLACVLDVLVRVRDKTPRPLVLAVDMPTGVDADGGAPDERAVAADATVALGYSKVGLHLQRGNELAGRVQVVDIGLPVAPEPAAQETHVMTLRDVRPLLPQRPADSNKGTFGKVMVAAGSRNYVGAAYLSASAAMRGGAGLVTAATPASVYPLIAGRLAEATFLPLPESESGRFYAGSGSELAAGLKGYNVLLLGCGIGQDSGTLGFVRDVLLTLESDDLETLIVDADGLNNLAQIPRWWESVSLPLVLTPHPGEFGRLTRLEVKDIQSRRLQLAREKAQEWRQVVVLKGANTIVASPDGGAWISPFASAALASAGTGDVLAGLIAGFAAQGLSPLTAAIAAVYVHGATGELLGDQMGDTGVLAGDILAAIPRTIKEIKS